MGRPTKLLDDLVSKRIVDAVKEGGSRTAAAEAANIGARTLFDWLARGRRGEEPYAQFLQRVKRAEAEAELAMVKVVREASRNSWQAGAWWLERRRPKLYALRRASEGRGALDDVRAQFANLNDEQLLAKLDEQCGRLANVREELRAKAGKAAK